MPVYALAHNGLLKDLRVTTHSHAEAARQFLKSSKDFLAGDVVIGEEDLKAFKGPTLVNLYNMLMDKPEDAVAKFDTKANGQRRTFIALETRYRSQPEEPFTPVEDVTENEDTPTSEMTLEGSKQKEGQMATAKKSKKKATKKAKAERKPRVASPLHADLGSGNKPTKDMNCGLYIRSLLMTGKFDTAKILEKVAAHYPDSKAKGSDVSWNRQKLRNGGKKVPTVEA